MASRINRAIELLAQDQAIYYVGAHSGHVLTRAQGREDAGTWADYIKACIFVSDQQLTAVKLITARHNKSRG